MSYVAKGTPPRFDIRTARDYLLSFDSRWPLLKISSTGNFSSTVTHGLGYPPFHLVMRSDGRVNEFADEYAVDSTTLARTSGADTPRYYIFRLNLTENFTADIVTGSTTQEPPSSNYVFKMTKPGKDTDSTDMRDFSLHSNTRSPMLHMVDHGVMSNTGAGLGLERTVTHGLGYTPLAFVFMKPGVNLSGLDADKYGIVEPPVGASGKYYTVSNSAVYITADPAIFTATPSISVIILKDPFSREVVNVSFP